MDTSYLQVIADIGWAGAIVVFLLIVKPLIVLLAKFIDAKINSNMPYDVGRDIKIIKDNHLHEVIETLKRIEANQVENHRELIREISDLQQNIIFIKAKINGK